MQQFYPNLLSSVQMNRHLKGIVKTLSGSQSSTLCFNMCWLTLSLFMLVQVAFLIFFSIAFFAPYSQSGWFVIAECGCVSEPVIVHGPEQISVPSGWAKLGNIFYVHICPVHYLSHDRPMKLAAFMWLSSIFNILFSKNSIFVFFDDFQILFKSRPSSMTVLNKYNCSNTSRYPFEL